MSNYSICFYRSYILGGERWSGEWLAGQTDKQAKFTGKGAPGLLGYFCQVMCLYLIPVEVELGVMDQETPILK